MNSVTKKEVAKHNVPILNTSPDADLSFSYLLHFINDLRRAKTLDLFESDGLLINSALNASNKTEIFSHMPVEASNDLDEFISYLLKAYGKTKSQIRRLLRNIKQRQSEPPISFFSRVIMMYYLSKGENEVPTIETLAKTDTTPQSQRDDIVELFVEGLENHKVKIALKSQLTSIDFDDLPTRAAEIIDAYSELPSESVINNISEQLCTLAPELSNKVDQLSQDMKVMKIAVDKTVKRANNYAKSRNNNFRKQSYQNNNFRNQNFQQRQFRKNYNSYRGGFRKQSNYGRNNYNNRNKTNYNSNRKFQNRSNFNSSRYNNNYRQRTNYLVYDDITDEVIEN